MKSCDIKWQKLQRCFVTRLDSRSLWCFLSLVSFYEVLLFHEIPEHLRQAIRNFIKFPLWEKWLAFIINCRVIIRDIKFCGKTAPALSKFSVHESKYNVITFSPQINLEIVCVTINQRMDEVICITSVLGDSVD